MAEKKIPWRVIAWSMAAALLLLPLIAMQFTNEVAWGSEDFIFAALLIFGTGIAYEVILKLINNHKIRIISALALGFLFLLIWADAAIDIF